MNFKRVTVTSIRIALLCVVIASGGRILRAQSEIHFRLIDGNLIVIALNSGGSSFDFLLDTGADTTVIDPAIAPRLSFVPADQVEVVSLSGSRSDLRGAIPTLTVGNAKVDNLNVLVQELPEFRKLDAHIVGILGQNFLSHFNYILDYRRQLVRFESENEVQDTIDGEHVAIESRDQRMIVASHAQSRGNASLHLVLDSGAGSLVLMRTASQVLNPPREATLSQLVSGGEVEMKSGRVNQLTVGTEKLRQVAALMPDFDPGISMGDGLLPTILFRSLYVNNHDGFVVFNPRIRRR